MRAGRASCDDRMVRPLKAVHDRDIARCKIDQAARDEERRNPARASLFQGERGVGDAFDAANPRTDQNAGAVLILFVLRLPARVFQRLGRGSNGIDDKVIDLALFLRLHPLIGVEGAVRAVTALYLRGDLAGQIGGVEFLDLRGSALSVEDVFPRRIDIRAKRRDHSKASDNHATHAQISGSELWAKNQTSLTGPSWPDQGNLARLLITLEKNCGSVRVLFQKRDGIPDGQNGFRRSVGNFAAELFLERHDQLDRVEAVSTEVVNEARLVGNLFRVDPKMLDDDFFHALRNITHRSAFADPTFWLCPSRRLRLLP